jgi:hypothetical protein
LSLDFDMTHSSDSLRMSIVSTLSSSSIESHIYDVFFVSPSTDEQMEVLLVRPRSPTRILSPLIRLRSVRLTGFLWSVILVFSSPTKYPCFLMFLERRWALLPVGVHVFLPLDRPADLSSECVLWG